jgi:poly [ADP-ribose] polymerase 2/3/4
MPNVVETKKFVLSSIEVNSNKVWQYTLYDNDDVLCEWGRVGKGMQSKTFSGVGLRYAEKKAREKENKGYRAVATLDSGGSTSSKVVAKGNLKDIAKRQIQSTNPVVVKLIEYLTDVNAHNIYDATGGKITFDVDSGLFKTPLGIVTKDSIDEARKILASLGDAVAKQKFGLSSTRRHVEDYLMLIPQEVGRKLTVEGFLPDLAAVQKQNDVLDGLESSYASAMSGAKDDKGKKVVVAEKKLFNVAMDVVTEGKVVDRIKKLYGQTRNRMHVCHSLKVHRVYSVSIAFMLDAFNAKGKKIGNVRDLWHGTRASNLLSILKGGFVIPPSNASHCTGRMYGNGVYFSDQSTKSLNYAYGYWGGSRDSNCFMFLCQVAMGKEYIPATYGRSFPKSGYNSTFAKAGRSGVQNNEMIVYKTNQVNPVFLIEFKK